MENLFESLKNLRINQHVDADLLQTVLNEAEELQEDKKRKRGDKLRITCAGIYNAGKSSLLNALIGKEQFQVGDVPTTATIDEYVLDRVVYVDTPGLNANDYDNATAEKAFKTADLILFVSNVQNGGLNAAEAEYLRKIADTLGGMEHLQKQVLLVMSNMHQIEEESVQKVMNEHSSMIQHALGFIPEKICMYDAVTYQEGIGQGEQILVEISGIPALKAEIERRSGIAAAQQEELMQKRIAAKQQKLTEHLEALIAPLEAEMKKLKKRAKAGSVDAGKLEEVIAFYEGQEISFKLPFEVNPLSLYYGLSHYAGYLHVSEKSSEYAVKSEIKEKLSRAHERREKVVKEKANSDAERLASYTVYEQKKGNFYYDLLTSVNAAIIDCNDAFRKAGIKLPGTLIMPIDSTPKLKSISQSEIARELCDGVVDYGEYYTVKWYVDHNVDVDDYEKYLGEGMFGRPRYKTVYSGDGDAALRDMANDMDGTYKSNLNSQWNRVKKPMEEYAAALKETFRKRLQDMIAEARNQAAQAGNNSTAEEAENLDKLIKPLRQYLREVQV